MLLGAWIVVVIYALIHDQYLVSIAPEHFTVYNPPLWGVENPRLLAAVYAFQASLSPSLLLGVACILASQKRKKKRERIPVKYVMSRTVVVVLLTELVCLASWLYVTTASAPLYPKSWYPDLTKPIIATQTIQITCYCSAAFFSLLLILHLYLKENPKADQSR